MAPCDRPVEGCGHVAGIVPVLCWFVPRRRFGRDSRKKTERPRVIQSEASLPDRDQTCAWDFMPQLKNSSELFQATKRGNIMIHVTSPSVQLVTTENLKTWRMWNLHQGLPRPTSNSWSRPRLFRRASAAENFPPCNTLAPNSDYHPAHVARISAEWFNVFSFCDASDDTHYISTCMSYMAVSSCSTLH